MDVKACGSESSTRLSSSARRTNSKRNRLCAFDVNRVAQMLDVSRSTVYRLIRDKHLTLVKVGKRGSRVTAESVSEFLKAREPADAG